MGLRFTVLASGSSGNSCLIRTPDFGLMLDAGLGPRMLAGRLADVGASWLDVQAVLLTHTHSDHWNENTLVCLAKKRIPFFCHAGHIAFLQAASPGFAELEKQELVRSYRNDEIALGFDLRIRPIVLRHDGGDTFGFRISGATDLFGQACALAYAADLGSWGPALAQELADVDLLALEFNHDVPMQLGSGRHPQLIARVLGEDGHLSNEQAAELLREVIGRSTPGRLRHLVQLHLSRQCNHPKLARHSADQVLDALCPEVAIYTSRQDQPGETIDLGRDTPARIRERTASNVPGSRSTARRVLAGPFLPGMNEA